MKLFLRTALLAWLVLFLAACSLPVNPPSIITVTPPTPSPRPARPTPTPTEVLCAFVEGRQQLKELSVQLLDRLKTASLEVETARAEAYGENCIAADGSLVRFAARETDYYITLAVRNLNDQALLGSLLEKTLIAIQAFPVGTTPGPNPGYVGVSFKAGDSIKNTWFLRSKASDLLAKGVHGAELYENLVGSP